ncbi:alginate O-acetyltransferase AlgX-related protein [Pseudomonas sp.]|uniref:alginate O-acetyltransferase AlgX-related protein n=1 Tax=Pseudomonas sp. TaxID=306 RepID=UPI0028A20F60|nr:hypothetical protein [Pseudomonas sp.]
MKKLVIVFFATALALLLIAPVVNTVIAISTPQTTFKYWRKNLYNLDFASQALAKQLYPLGISTDPEKVVVGNQGWLYLGDSYAKSITTKRAGYNPADEAALQGIADNIASWNTWFSEHGVKAFRVVIGPDKDSVYPEHLPAWAAHATPSAMDVLVSKSNPDLVIYPKAALIAAKSRFLAALYYKTDTHWNVIGGTIAFNGLVASMAAAAPALSWPAQVTADDLIISDKAGGDLAAFLRIRNSLHDSEVGLRRYVETPLPVEQQEFFTGKAIDSQGSTDVLGLTTATLVSSPVALNDKRVLWLRDSYGTAMATLMAATFRETLQLHHNRASQQMLTELIDKFKPEYVIVTHVERDVRGGFLTLRPVLEVSHSRDGFSAVSTAVAPQPHHLKATATPDQFAVDGIDPFVVFDLDRPTPTANVSRLMFELSCDSNQEQIPVQLYWHSEQSVFSEANSITVIARNGLNSLSLLANPAWANDAAVTQIRLDLADPAKCSNVAFRNVQLGIVH